MHDLAEHTGALIGILGTSLAIIGALLTVISWFAWMAFRDVRTKVDSICKTTQQCREELPEKYAKNNEFEKFKEKFWRVLKGHRHIKDAVITDE